MLLMHNLAFMYIPQSIIAFLLVSMELQCPSLHISDEYREHFNISNVPDIALYFGFSVIKYYSMQFHFDQISVHKNYLRHISTTGSSKKIPKNFRACRPELRKSLNLGVLSIKILVKMLAILGQLGVEI